MYFGSDTRDFQRSRQRLPELAILKLLSFGDDHLLSAKPVQRNQNGSANNCEKAARCIVNILFSYQSLTLYFRASKPVHDVQK